MTVKNNDYRSDWIFCEVKEHPDTILPQVFVIAVIEHI